MLTAASFTFILALATAASLTPIIRGVAHRVGALDYAHGSRKVHGLPVPRLGGVAIVFAFYASLIALAFVDTSVAQLVRADPRQAAGIFFGGTAIAALGIYDDLRGTKARTKLAVQFAVAGLVYALGFRIDEISNPFGDAIHLGWFGLPLTMLWVAGVVNAINLIDGLDGLAGGVALVSAGVTFVLSVMHAEPLMALVSAALAGAILGFLRYNFNPASIFMGDTGSMFLGFVLATSSLASHQSSSTALTLLVPVVALGLPVADTLLAIVRRALRGAPLFGADRDHIHHRLLGRGLSHRQTVLAMYGASVVLGAAALALASSPRWLAWGIVGALALATALLLRGLGYLKFVRAREILERRRRNLELHAGVREAGEWLHDADEVDEIWAAVKSAADMLGAGRVELVLLGGAVRGARRSRHFEHGAVSRDDVLVTRHGLHPSRVDGGWLELVWAPGQAALDRDTEIAVETLCDHLRSALERIETAPTPLRRPSGNAVAPRGRAGGMTGRP